MLPQERDRLELVRDWNDGEDYIEAQDAGAARALRIPRAAPRGRFSRRSVEPGVYEVKDGRLEAESPGLRLHAVQFTP